MVSCNIIKMRFDLITLTRELFVARDDTYAVQQDVAHGGGYLRVSAPLTDHVLHSHMVRKKTLAVYPAKDNTTKWLVFDLDEEDCWDLILIKGILAHHDIQSYLEDSGRYWHLWILFAQPISNCIARKLADYIVREAHCYNRIEIYPKQDAVTECGSCVKLPFGVNRKSEKRSCFVDDGKISIKNPEVFFRSIERVPEGIVREIFEVNDIAPLLLTPALSTALSVVVPRSHASGTSCPKFDEPCVEKYWSDGALEGRRASVSYQIAIRLRELNLPVGDALDQLKVWRTRCDLGKHHFTEKELESQVNGAYAGEPKKARCGHGLLKEVCVGKDKCPFCTRLKRSNAGNGHNEDAYLWNGWQKVLSAGQMVMVRVALPVLEKKKGLRPGEVLFTTKEELAEYSGLGNPGDALNALKKYGLVEYTAGNRGGGKERKPTVVRRITPVSKPPHQSKEPTLGKDEGESGRNASCSSHSGSQVVSKSNVRNMPDTYRNKNKNSSGNIRVLEVARSQAVQEHAVR